MTSVVKKWSDLGCRNVNKHWISSASYLPHLTKGSNSQAGAELAIHPVCIIQYDSYCMFSCYLELNRLQQKSWREDSYLIFLFPTVTWIFIMAKWPKTKSDRRIVAVTDYWSYKVLVLIFWTAFHHFWPYLTHHKIKNLVKSHHLAKVYNVAKGLTLRDNN